MKKIIIAMIAIVGSFAVNAAAINWSAAGVGSSADNALSGANQYSAYFFATADSSSQLTLTTIDAVVSTILAGGDLEALASYTKQNTYVASTGMATFSSTGNGNFDAGTTVSGFVVILDATTLADANNYMLATDSSGNNILTKTAGSTGAMTFGWQNQTNNGSTWQAVPEPTSGLLLLLGMAGLALRRKRA